MIIFAMKKKRSEAFRKENLFILYLLIFVFIITLFSYIILRPSVDSTLSDSQKVIKVNNDGTLVLESGIKVKLLCISPLENSKSFLEGLVLNKNIRLASDPKENDRFKTISRYVYIQSDAPESCEVNTQINDRNVISDETCSIIGSQEIFVNKELLSKSYAKYEPYSNQNCELLL
jgi:hypothetical protein